MNIHGARRPAKGHQQRLFTYPSHSEPREGFCRVILRREIGWSHPKLLSPYPHPQFLEENLSNEFFNDHIEGRFRPPLFIVSHSPFILVFLISLSLKYPQQRLLSASIYCCPQDFGKTDVESAFCIISIHLLNLVLLVV